MPEPGWVLEHAPDLLVEFFGGFTAYVLHHLYTPIFKRLARSLLRKALMRGA